MKDLRLKTARLIVTVDDGLAAESPLRHRYRAMSLWLALSSVIGASGLAILIGVAAYSSGPYSLGGVHDLPGWFAILLPAGLMITVTMIVLVFGMRVVFAHQQRLENDLRRREEEYRTLALYDALTGLPNRTLLADRVRKAIADAARNGNLFGLMILDLDRFKEVNDSLGHGAGDELLCESARRLQSLVRACDTVARLGGDEFAIVLPGVRDAGDLRVVARKLIDALSAPYMLCGREIFVSASIGIALYPSDSAVVEELFRFADSAMYLAKQEGRNNFQFYVAELAARTSERMETAAALHKAVRNGELELYFQPQVDLRSGSLVGVEALLRWNRPGHGLVTPEKFIPIAEESGLIVEIGEWILDNACRVAVQWNRTRTEPLKMSLNVSTRQFIRNDFVASLHRIIEATGCSPEWIALEITESLLLEDSEEVSCMLASLHGMGISIAIDDFGTGYSALSYLDRFPVSQIKIDRSFVKDIPEDRHKSELVKAMLSISSALHLQVVAEGVEETSQADYLMAHGCWLAQGYLFGKPMQQHTIEQVLQRASGTVDTRSLYVVATAYAAGSE